jgi:nitrite reductase (NADH) small subunit
VTATTEVCTWVAVCRLDDNARESVVAALVHGHPVAVFRDHLDRVHVLSNLDPVTGASVLARGIVGTRGGVPFVASPMHKQPYRLSDGVCLDDEAVRVPTWAVRVVDGVVQVGPRDT